MSTFALAFGLATSDSNGNWLDTYYPSPQLKPDQQLVEKLASITGYSGGNVALELDAGQMAEIADSDVFHAQQAELSVLTASSENVIACILETDAEPATVPEVYLKLHLLSHRLCKPHTLNLTGMFAVLPNVAWTNQGAVAIDELPEKQLRARANGELLEVMSVDKFPKMTNYVVPKGVRIAHTARVRLGAYIGEGTTVMHEGFVNFNAGTEGVAMIEGRISAGVFIGNGSDLGGGCSTMGTLSGGGNEVISVGENCLIGANAGLGIPLGDRCTLESGLYITAGTKVTILDSDNNEVEVLSARKLAGKNDLLFRRNSITGRVECLTNKSRIELNSELHSHN